MAVDLDKWCDYAIRFVAGIYDSIIYFWKEADEISITGAVCAIAGFIDGLNPDQRAFVQPSLGFVDNPADWEKKPLVLLPLYGTSSIAEWADGVVHILYTNPSFPKGRLAMMSEEQLGKLKSMLDKIDI